MAGVGYSLLHSNINLTNQLTRPILNILPRQRRRSTQKRHILIRWAEYISLRLNIYHLKGWMLVCRNVEAVAFSVAAYVFRRPCWVIYFRNASHKYKLPNWFVEFDLTCQVGIPYWMEWAHGPFVPLSSVAVFLFFGFGFLNELAQQGRTPTMPHIVYLLFFCLNLAYQLFFVTNISF